MFAGSFSWEHWAIVFVVVMLLFGRGAVSRTMTDLGKTMKQIKNAGREIVGGDE